MTIFKIWVDSEEGVNSQSLLSTSGRVLIGLSENPAVGHLALSLMLGVTETAIEKAVAKLVKAGMLKVEKNGRRNKYTILWDVVYCDRDFKIMKEFYDNQKRLSNT
jgi:DNA-binding transcriptional regulator PaaX